MYLWSSGRIYVCGTAADGGGRVPVCPYVIGANARIANLTHSQWEMFCVALIRDLYNSMCAS